MKMEETECPGTSAYKIQTPRYHPKERMQHPQHGESLKSRIFVQFVEILGSLKISKEIVNDFRFEQAVDGGGSVTNMTPACHIDIVETSESNEQNPRVKKDMFVL